MTSRSGCGSRSPRSLTPCRRSPAAIVTASLKGLGENPFPGSGKDKEPPNLQSGRSVYRLPIARTYTAFSGVDSDAGFVSVYELQTIEQAHKRYGRL